MCVWVAYTGKQQAAPILTECGERIEGLWSGFYTGLVTCDEAGLHCGKVAGWSKYWHEAYKESDFPGCTGLWHSRTNSGGDHRWAHPFVGNAGVVGMVSQGNAGVFADRDAEHFQMANQALKAGMSFPSAAPVLEGRKAYPTMDDGTQIHISDFVAQLIEQHYLQHGEPLAAIRHAMESIREEATNVVIFRDRPGKLYFGTTSQHLVAARFREGVALSITDLAFGQPCPRTTELPENSVGYIAPGQLYVETLSPLFASIDETMPAGLLTAARQFLAEHGPATLAELCDKVVRPRLGTGLVIRSTITYRVLQSLGLNGDVAIQPRVVPGRSGFPGRSDLIVLRGDCATASAPVDALRR